MTVFSEKRNHAAVGGGNVALNILFVSVPYTAEIAVGARAEAGIFLKRQYFRLCRDSKPGFAKLEISYWT